MDRKNEIIVYESAMARMERMNRRLWVLCLVLIALLIISSVVYYKGPGSLSAEKEKTEQKGVVAYEPSPDNTEEVQRVNPDETRIYKQPDLCSY